MNRQEALQIVGTLSAAHPAWKASEATVALWVDLLADLPYEPTRAAVRRIVATSDDWPSLAKVRRAVADGMGLLPPPVDVACRQFLDAARGRGRDLDPLVVDTVEALGGWPQIRQAGNVSVLIGQFRSLYADARARAEQDATEDPVGVAQIAQQSRPELTA